MSRSALLLALLLAFLLALAWALSVTPLGNGTGRDRVEFDLSIDPADVRQIDVDRGAQSIMLRRALSARWTLVTSPDEPAWRMDDDPVDAVFAALSSGSITKLSDGQGSPIDPLTIVLREPGARQELQVTPSIAGQCSLYADPPGAWFAAPSELFTTFSPETLLALRSRAALPSASVNASRVTIGAPDAEEIVLVREGARWHLAEPDDALADPEGVERLLSVLASLRFASLRPAPESPDPVRGTRLMISVLWSEFAPGADQPHLEEEQLWLHEIADSPRSVLASRSPNGPAYRLDPAPLSSISTVASTYVSRHAMAAPEHDIGAIVIDFIHPPLTRTLRRGIHGWTISERLPDQTEPSGTRADGSAVDSLLSFLLDARADAVSLAHAGEDEQALARITLCDVVERRIAECALVRLSSLPDAPATRTRKALRVFAQPVPELLTP